MNILFVSNQDLLIDLAQISAVHSMINVHFWGVKDLEDKFIPIDAVLIDTRFMSGSLIRALIKQYNKNPVFVIANKAIRRSLFSVSNIAAVFSSEISIHTIAKSIEVFFSPEKRSLKSKKGDINVSVTEAVILEYLLKEKSYKEIARDLDIFPSTVKYYTGKIYEKFDVKNRKQLAFTVKKIGV